MISTATVIAVFPNLPVSLWLRLLNETGDTLSDAVLRVVEVLAALLGYGMISKSSASLPGVIDALKEWASKSGNHTCMVINARMLVLGCNGNIVVVDTSTGTLVHIPDHGAPVITSALHLDPLRQQTLSRIQSASAKAVP
jgi:hypothetical protein